MSNYSDVQTRSSYLAPDDFSAEVIKELPKASVALSRMRKVRLSTKTSTQPVLSALPDAYWVNGDSGMKQTTKAGFSNLSITAEELAAIVVIPDAYVADSKVPLWDEIRPLVVEAIGRKVDQASLFGTDKPTSWPTAVVPGAIAAGNTIELGTGADIGVDVASLAEKVALDGFSVNGFAAAPGLNWRLIGARNTQGGQVYQPGSGLDGTPAGSLYGLPLNECTNGAWDSSAAELLAADWSKFVIGVRQDITVQMFDQGVVSDDAGKVLVNLMQQDSKAMRVVFRVGFQVANPLTRLGGAGAYAAGVLTPAAP